MALATKLQPPELIKGFRHLVKNGIAAWRYEIAIKFAFKSEKALNKRLEELNISVQIFLDWLKNTDIEIDEDKSFLIHKPLEEDLQQINNKMRLDAALQVISKLNLCRYQKESVSTKRIYLEGNEELKSLWIEKVRETWQHKHNDIKTIVEILITWSKKTNKEWKFAKNQIINIAELEDILHHEKLINETPLELLDVMQHLNLVFLGRGNTGYESLYHLSKTEERENWSDNIYIPLNEHYEQRGQRIYALKKILSEPSEGSRVDILRDYFTLSLEAFNQKYLQEILGSEGGFGSPPKAAGMLKELNPSQKKIVKDDHSRALLVLAGPGSGKTHTIVRRIGYLILAKGVPPEKILVLAYNRTAAAELRKRLHKLLGSQGARVDAITFHALAAKLTGLKKNDLRQEIKKLNRSNKDEYQILLEKAIEYLEENHPNYQYILVDEYQDVDELKYKLIKSLAGFNADDIDEEQKSFLVAVGDDDQTLFEFQGANPKFIHLFNQDYKLNKDNTIYLLENHRSYSTIVNFSNLFIERAIPEGRLKDINHRVQPTKRESGKVFWGKYNHSYHAAEWIVEKIYNYLHNNTPLEEIAVLAHRWHDLRFIQHILQEKGILYQFYSTKDDNYLQPVNSRVGQAILEHLWKNPNLYVPEPQNHLEMLRKEFGYSNQDAAWDFLIHSLKDCSAMTQADIAELLEEVRPLKPGGVVLSTFHSAKGSEFSNVFILEEGDKFTHKDDFKICARKLYVGFTRAKEELIVLFNQKQRHSQAPALIAMKVLGEMQKSDVRNIQILEIKLPKQIRYKYLIEPADLRLSDDWIIKTQHSIEEYTQEWGNIYIDINQNKIAFQWNHFDHSLYNFINSPIAVLSNNGEKKLRPYLKHNVSAYSHTVFRVPRDEEFVPEDWQGTHHYIVLPRLQIEEVINN